MASLMASPGIGWAESGVFEVDKGLCWMTTEFVVSFEPEVFLCGDREDVAMQLLEIKESLGDLAGKRSTALR